MHVDLTSEQQAFRDEMRSYMVRLMTQELVDEMRGGEGGGPGPGPGSAWTRS